MKRILAATADLIFSAIAGAETNENRWETDTMNLVTILTHEEGFRSRPYKCSEDYVTIGFGTKLHNSKGLDPAEFPIVVDRDIAKAFLLNDVAKIETKLQSSSAWLIFESLDDDRRAVIVSMAYQMGVSGVLRFRKMWAALELGFWGKAAEEALDSRWAKQTPQRAERHARALRGESLLYIYNPPHNNLK